MKTTGSRYRIEGAARFAAVLWRVRARLVDSETGDELELGRMRAAEAVRDALERADAGELPRLPVDASPFRRFEISTAGNGWHYLWRAEGALNHQAFARTRSEELAARVVEALNRSDPRRLRDPYGPPKARWF